jgi:hypothetical protein
VTTLLARRYDRLVERTCYGDDGMDPRNGGSDPSDGGVDDPADGAPDDPAN